MTDFALPDYAVLGQETAPYELQLAEILGKLPGSKRWFQFGDCDSFKVDIAVTKKSRDAKRGRVRVTSIEVVDSIKTSITVKAMQFRDEIRGAAFLGELGYLTQDPIVASTYAIEAEDFQPGIFYIDDADGNRVYDVTTVTIAGLTEGTHFKIVDHAAGGVEIYPDAPGLGTAKVLTFSADGITEADKRTRIEIGTKPEFEMALKARGTSANGTPAEITLYSAKLAPSGGVEQLSDDFASVDLGGACTNTNKGVGTWQRLKN